MLAAIERELADEAFLVIGVHSPKFTAQRSPEMVKEAIRRLGVTHPVVLDPDAAITHSFGVRGWPTMTLVGPDGTILGQVSGEPEPQALLQALREVLDLARREGALSPRPLPLHPDPGDDHRLLFPGAVAAGADRLYVADTGHGAVVACDAQGNELQRYPAGQPHGLAVAGDGTLFVADTPNHAIRAFPQQQTTAAPPLRSPWGLAWHPDSRRLFIANAGTHQILVHDPAANTTTIFAGTGVEGGRDGDAEQAWFAQPSGLALLDGVLYVADSETSSIRAISDLDKRPRVSTVSGEGDLFGFGDRDGTGPAAAMQHPIGLTAGDGTLYVADTFNHKIRSIDPWTGNTRTIFGGGGPEIDPGTPTGSDIGPAQPDQPAFSEPEGLAWRPHDGGELIVADTGNHRVLSVRLADGARRVLLGG